MNKLFVFDKKEEKEKEKKYNQRLMGMRFLLELLYIWGANVINKHEKDPLMKQRCRCKLELQQGWWDAWWYGVGAVGMWTGCPSDQPLLL